LAENSQQESNMSARATMRGDQLESFMTVTERPIDESQQVLVRIAESNEVPIEWPELKYIIKSQLSKMREEGTEETDAVNGLYSKLLEERNKLLEDIIKRLDKFNETPFTIQRVAELMIKPHEYYVNTVKWLRGLEKVLSVHSSTKSFPDGGQVEASLTLSEADTADVYGSIHDAEETTRNESNADDQSMDEDEAEAYLDAVINGDESVNNDEENITVRATENFYYGLLSMDSTDE
ncbi:10261_t:CDS:2, partial [Paraglomus occultum]